MEVLDEDRTITPENYFSSSNTIKQEDYSPPSDTVKQEDYLPSPSPLTQDEYGDLKRELDELRRQNEDLKDRNVHLHTEVTDLTKEAQKQYFLSNADHTESGVLPQVYRSNRLNGDGYVAIDDDSNPFPLTDDCMNGWEQRTDRWGIINYDSFGNLMIMPSAESFPVELDGEGLHDNSMSEIDKSRRLDQLHWKTILPDGDTIGSMIERYTKELQDQIIHQRTRSKDIITKSFLADYPDGSESMKKDMSDNWLKNDKQIRKFVSDVIHGTISETFQHNNSLKTFKRDWSHFPIASLRTRTGMKISVVRSNNHMYTAEDEAETISEYIKFPTFHSGPLKTYFREAEKKLVKTTIERLTDGLMKSLWIGGARHLAPTTIDESGKTIPNPIYDESQSRKIRRSVKQYISRELHRENRLRQIQGRLGQGALDHIDIETVSEQTEEDEALGKTPISIQWQAPGGYFKTVPSSKTIHIDRKDGMVMVDRDM